MKKVVGDELFFASSSSSDSINSSCYKRPFKGAPLRGRSRTFRSKQRRANGQKWPNRDADLVA